MFSYFTRLRDETPPGPGIKVIMKNGKIFSTAVSYYPECVLYPRDSIAAMY
jgi:hypothetical protein